MPELPYLEGRPRELFDAWHESAVARFSRNLTFREIRKGAQALSSIYVEKRGRVPAAKALDGQGKRAAFVLYYGALHYIVVHHVVQRAGLHEKSLRRLLDLGCGSGASASAWANLLPNDAMVTGVDRSGWALQEAGRTYAAFGLRHETLRSDILEQAPPGEGEGVLLAWAVDELHPSSRDFLLKRVQTSVAAGASLLVLEPVARAAAPWMGSWAEALAPHGARLDELRVTVRLPPWLAHMDKASGMRHGSVTVRALHA